MNEPASLPIADDGDGNGNSALVIGDSFITT